MRDFAIVTCLKNVDVSVKKPNIFERIIKYIPSLFNKPRIDECLTKGIKKVELFKGSGTDNPDESEDNFNIHLFKLPFQLCELEALGYSEINKIEDFIRNYCAASNIDLVITPKHILEKSKFQSFNTNPYTGRILFKSLFLNTLDEIYLKRGIKIRDLDIAIVRGKSVEELFCFIRLLAPSVRYLTIISEDKESIEKQTEQIYEETGLSVRITNDFKTGFKGVNLIVNLGSFSPGMKINPQAIILNYGDIDSDKLLGENIIINGIDVRLPGDVLKLGNETLEHFQNQKFAELLLCRKLGIGHEQESDVNFAVDARISEEFARASFVISGFTGRRNIIKAKDIKVHKSRDSA